MSAKDPTIFKAHLTTPPEVEAVYQDEEYADLLSYDELLVQMGELESLKEQLANQPKNRQLADSVAELEGYVNAQIELGYQRSRAAYKARQTALSKAKGYLVGKEDPETDRNTRYDYESVLKRENALYAEDEGVEIPTNINFSQQAVKQVRWLGHTAYNLRQAVWEASRQIKLIDEKLNNIEQLLANNPDEEQVQTLTNTQRELFADRETLKTNMARYAVDFTQTYKLIKTVLAGEGAIANEGLLLEKAFRDTHKEAKKYRNFRRLRHNLIMLNKALRSATLRDLPTNVEDPESQLSSREAMQLELYYNSEVSPDGKFEGDEESMRMLFGADADVESINAELVQHEASRKSLAKDDSRYTSVDAVFERFATTAAIQKEIARVTKDINQIWEQSGKVQEMEHSHYMRKLLKDVTAGKRVLETPSSIEVLNTLYTWEMQDPQSVKGGYLVGPPGVGKTTLIRHYLEAMGRKYVYIDMSKEVTRYMLFGSKAIEFESESDYYQKLSERIQNLSDEQFADFIREKAEEVGRYFHLEGEDAIALTVQQLQEELNLGISAAHNPKLTEQLTEVRKNVEGQALRAFHRELATEFSHLTQKNGWREGLIGHALLEKKSIIFDEANKSQDWAPLYDLLEVRKNLPDGTGRYYMGDNNKEYVVPADWHVYCTANIGTKYGVYQNSEPLVSRFGGKAMEVGYPSATEEFHVSLAFLANPNNLFIPSDDDLAKLYILIHNIIPGVRASLASKPDDAISISYRTLEQFAHKLVHVVDPVTRRPIYKRSQTSFDLAFWEVFIDTYKLQANRSLGQSIVETAATHGLLMEGLPPSVLSAVKGIIGESKYTELHDLWEQQKKDGMMKNIHLRIRGLRNEPQSQAFYNPSLISN